KNTISSHAASRPRRSDALEGTTSWVESDLINYQLRRACKPYGRHQPERMQVWIYAGLSALQRLPATRPAAFSAAQYSGSHTTRPIAITAQASDQACRPAGGLVGTGLEIAFRLSRGKRNAAVEA